jgi:hypothetical protein
MYLRFAARVDNVPGLRIIHERNQNRVGRVTISNTWQSIHQMNRPAALQHKHPDDRARVAVVVTSI